MTLRLNPKDAARICLAGIDKVSEIKPLANAENLRATKDLLEGTSESDPRVELVLRFHSFQPDVFSAQELIANCGVV